MKEESKRNTVPWLALALLLVAAVCAVLLMFPRAESVAQGGTITVSTTADEFSNPGPEAGCALREAIQAINKGISFGGCVNTSGTADTIIVPAGTYTLTRLANSDTYTNGQGSLMVQAVDLTIEGAGPDKTIITTTASWDDRVFYFVHSSGGAPRDAALQGLSAYGGNSNGAGGGLYVNWYGGPEDVGGATFDLTDVVIRDNVAQGSGGGIYFEYGPLASLRNVTISDNKGANGGGIYYAAVYITDALTIINSTISSNTAENSGGGLYLEYPSYATVTVDATNVTFFGNQAETGSGGNIYNYQSDISLANCIIAGGSDLGGPNNCAGNPAANITSLGYNVDSGDTCGLDATGDLTDTNPLLHPLGDYGGGTLTHKLAPDSPAANHIPLGTNGCGTTILEDQRGIPRPQAEGGSCDVGAFELGYPVLAIYKTAEPDTVLAYHDELTYTIVLSNAGAGMADSVSVTDTLPAEVAFDRWVIQPSGASVDGDGELTWSGDVAADQALTFTLIVSHVGDYEDVVVNTAEFEHWSGSGTDTVTVMVAGPPTLNLDKAAEHGARVEPGTAITYSLVFSNSGDSDAYDAAVYDPLPDLVSFVEWVPGGQPPGATITADELTWTGTVAGGDAVVFAFVVTNTAAEGEVVINEAGYTYDGVTGTAEVQFLVQSTWKVYLPVVVR